MQTSRQNTSRSELQRALGPWAAASIVVGTVIGSGIFLVPRTMIQRVGSVEMVFAVWVVGGLLSMAGALERCFTRFNAYNNAGCGIATTNVPSTEGKYLVSASFASATQFTVSAVPQGTQAKDTGCGTLSIDQANVRSKTGTKSVAECWGR